MTYFEGAGRARGDGEVRVVRRPERRRFNVSDGIAIEPVLGARLNVNLVVLDAGAVAPVHTHDEEQIGYVVTGGCELTDGDRTWTLGPGDAYHCPPGAPHGARALAEGCLIVDAFAPPRAGIAELLDGSG